MVKQIGSILDMVNNRITGVGTPSAASDTIRNDDTRLSNTRTPSGAAGGDLGSTYPNPTVVKSLADFAVGGNLTVGSGLGQVIIPISGSTAKGRLQSLPSTPNWLGYTLNCAYSVSGWLLDDTSIPGWFFKLDSRAASVEYAVYFIPAGANPHTDERFVFKVDSTNLVTVAGRITGISAPSAASDAIRHDDTRLSNTRTPTAHAASHGSGQADAVTIAESQVTSLVSDLAAKAASVHTHAAADVASGNLDTARLGATPAATTYLKGAASGAATWVVPSTLKTDLALTKTDVGLANVPNTDATNASNLASGTVPQARLGASGTRDTTTFLRGDNAFAVPPDTTYAPSSGIAFTGNLISIAVGGVTSNMLQDNEITATDINSTYKDGAAATPSLRTLGTGAAQAAAGNHVHTVADITAGGIRSNETYLRGDGNWGQPVPAGTLAHWGGLSGSVPSGWFLCNGGAVSRTGFANLYAALGGASSVHGQGDGSTTFNLPNIGAMFDDNTALTQAQVVASAATGYTLTLVYGAIKNGIVHLYLTMVRTGVTVALANPNHAQQNVGSLTANFAPVNSVSLSVVNAPRWGDLRSSGTINLLSGLANSSYTSSNITQNDSYSASVVYPMDPASTLPKVYTMVKA